MADIDFTQVGRNFVNVARSQFSEVLEEYPELDELVVSIGKSYATVTAEYYLAASDDDRDRATIALRQVRNNMDLVLDGMGHLAKSAILAQLKAALGMALELAIQNLPTIIAMVRR